MPIVRIELFPGRSSQAKLEVARAITRALQDIAGVSPESTTVMFTEVSPADWVVAGQPLGPERFP
ncbi:4-oxalocrotonate tautomerase family protein [Amaricoccus sp.]|uniref:tautomerase family protein n=1 Tax=Amaricoccus sp. TaxID=1872485 RepID=UPI001B55E8AE|nr:4-oxalocrotonate tautomerase family protein [Amaricoccus sp.]MBP7002672.1 4-oxalocrotonate tautomerase family protein [Amaricoccus sp.]